MKTNITTDNYEAYLLDYMEGNLNAETTAELKAFVATQGLDWSELTEELPYLEVPQVAYENKEKLKKKTAVVPLYVKIASAAAAAGLLFTVSLWPEKSRPKVEPIAELKPIHATLTVTEAPIHIIPRKALQLVTTQPIEKQPIEKQCTRHSITKSIESGASLSTLKPKEITTIAINEPDTQVEMEMLRYRLESEMAFVTMGNTAFIKEELPTSFIGRVIYRWSEGRYGSINELVNAGLSRSKEEIATVTTEIVMEAQQRAEESLADAREYWREKTEK